MLARDFLGEELWIEWMKDYESLMAFRKTIKGKPTEEQRAQLIENNIWIEYYKTVLFHDGTSKCSCRSCSMVRTYYKLPLDISLDSFRFYIEKYKDDAKQLKFNF